MAAVLLLKMIVKEGDQLDGQVNSLIKRARIPDDGICRWWEDGRGERGEDLLEDNGREERVGLCDRSPVKAGLEV